MLSSQLSLILCAALAAAACAAPEPEEPAHTSSDLLARRRGRMHACDAGRHPSESSACLFGSQFSDLRSNAALTIASELWVRTEAEIGELAAAQLVLAVQQSSHTDVTTAAEALAVVDQQEVRRMEVLEVAGERAFTVYEYGVGDNSYGAIFKAGSAELVASIHDGDLLDCTVPADS